MNIFSEKNPVSMIVNSLFKKKTTKKMLSGPKWICKISVGAIKQTTAILWHECNREEMEMPHLLCALHFTGVSN